MAQKKQSPILELALLLAIAAPASLVVFPSKSSLAQMTANSTEFSLPVAVSNPKIDSANSATVVNKTLKQRLEPQYGVGGELAAIAAPQPLFSGDIDLVAIDRSFITSNLTSNNVISAAETDTPASDTADAEADTAVTSLPSVATGGQAAPAWLWWMLPLLVALAILGWWWKRKRAADAASSGAASQTGGGDVPDGAIAADPTLASRASSVVTSDRSTIASGRAAVPPISPDVPPVPAEPNDLNLGTIAAAGATAGAAGLAGAAASEDASPTADPAEPETVPPVELVAPEGGTADAVDEAIAPAPSLETSLPLQVTEPEPTPPATPAVDVPDLASPLVAGAAVFAAMPDDHSQSDVEAAKFDVGQTDLSSEQLADVDSGLPDLPDGYGESRVVLLPRDPQWAYVYWDIPNEHRQDVRRQGGIRLALRLYDVTDVDIAQQNPHTMQQYDCEEFARDWYLPVPVSDRDYIAEVGYLTADGNWLMLARSAPAHIPPVYPSDWYDEQFITIPWEEDLRGKTFLELVPSKKKTAINNAIYTALFGMAQSSESMRVAGSLFGSMHQVPQQAISSFVFPSGIGLWAMPGGAIPTLSGIGMSGVGMSGIGFAASIPPIRPRKFWLVADAELIVYGATEPDATLTIANRPVQLNPDGTFRFQMSFQDGVLDFPIQAVAADGEQTRSIQMTFTRETPERNTNTKDEAAEDWFS